MGAGYPPVADTPCARRYLPVADTPRIFLCVGVTGKAARIRERIAPRAGRIRLWRIARAHLLISRAKAGKAARGFSPDMP